MLLFAYGSLQLDTVQLANFGRLLEGAPDFAPGYRLSTIMIDDPAVVAASGSAEHRIIAASGDPRDEVAGTVFEIGAAELAAADAYEVADYTRVEITLRSGRAAWAYVQA